MTDPLERNTQTVIQDSVARRISVAVLRASLWSALAGAWIAFAIWLRTSPELRPDFPVATWFGVSCALAFLPSLAMELGVTHLLLHLGPAEGEKRRI